jgi:hypothetical protein
MKQTPKPGNAVRIAVEPKKNRKKLTAADVKSAAEGGDKALEYFIENGVLPAR